MLVLGHDVLLADTATFRREAASAEGGKQLRRFVDRTQVAVSTVCRPCATELSLVVKRAS
jgi:hypothetical protein